MFFNDVVNFNFIAVVYLYLITHSALAILLKKIKQKPHTQTFLKKPRDLKTRLIYYIYGAIFTETDKAFITKNLWDHAHNLNIHVGFK